MILSLTLAMFFTGSAGHEGKIAMKEAWRPRALPRPTHPPSRARTIPTLAQAAAGEAASAHTRVRARANKHTHTR